MMQLRTPSYSCFEILHLLKDLLVFRHTGSGSRKPCSTDNPLVHLDGPEAERSVFGVLCLNACPAQSGQAEHPREGYPSSCSWNSPSYVLPLLLPPCVRRSAPPPEQLLQNHRCCLRARPPPAPPGPFPTEARQPRQQPGSRSAGGQGPVAHGSRTTSPVPPRRGRRTDGARP